ncbi:MAG: hypothetical protein BAJALOKI3v1_130058 [Promethearchaeota archaeon]|nr:MAG: hypothetical protein BAJALOKI3v1_130058 [Candidatus Lokiarchaeota archaeon]
MRKTKTYLKYIGLILAIIVISPVAIVGSMLIYWDMRPPPDFYADPGLKYLETDNWIAVPHGDDINYQHKSNTDMIYYDGHFYLINQESKWHLQDHQGKLVIRRSTDAKNWEYVHTIQLPNTDVRDPKFANVSGTLFVYFLPNYFFDPGPNTTYYCKKPYGSDTWTDPVEMKVNVSYYDENGDIGGYHKVGGWNFWRPKTNNNITWYVMATGRKNTTTTTEHDYDVSGTISVLFSSTDGENWTEVSEVYTRFGNAEVCLEFLADGRIISTHRVGSMGIEGYAFGNPHGGTIVATSWDTTYTNWSFAPDFQTRLDGATLFTLNNSRRVFAAGRNHLGPRSDMGNHLAEKRTAIYEVKEDRLVHLFDLPSHGDTAYTGVSIVNGSIYVCYYTCPVGSVSDYPWIVGIAFFTKTDIRMSQLNATRLLEYADSVGGG